MTMRLSSGSCIAMASASSPVPPAALQVPLQSPCPSHFCHQLGFIRVAFANLPDDQCKHACERLHRGLSELVAMEDSSALLSS